MNCYLFALLASIILLVSCTSHGSQVPTTPQPGESVAAGDLNLNGFPPIPTDRQPAEITQTILLGSEAYEHSDNATVDGTTLVLNSDMSNFSWGIWRFSPGEQTLISVEVDMTMQPGNEAYIGLADYSTGSWDFSGPYTGTQTLPLSDEKHKSAEGYTYVSVVTVGGSTATVHKLTLTTDDAWQIITVEEAGTTGGENPQPLVEYTSLLNVQGYPAICFAAHGSGGVQPGVDYVRATDANGTTWGVVNTVASIDYPSHISAATLDQGQPAVYWIDDWYTGEPRFAYATDLFGEHWSTTETIDTAGQPSDYGEFSYGFLSVDAGNPAVCYFDINYQELRYSHGDMLSHTWSTPEVLASAEAYFPSLIFDADGLPWIFYADKATHYLMMVSRNAEDTGWNEATALEDQSWYGNQIGVALVGSEIAVAYNDFSNASVKYARYDSESGQWVKQVVYQDPDGPTCAYISLAVINGNPAIAYCQYQRGNLVYVRALDAEGSAWGAAETVDAEGYTGYYTSLAEIDGRPAISYITYDTGALKFAIR